MYCANGTRIGPSKTIAEQFKIPWQQANADIVAGLADFDPKSAVADACAELAKQDPADAIPKRPEPIIDEDKAHADEALCEALGQEVKNDAAPNPVSDATIGKLRLLSMADKLMVDRYGMDEWRAEEVIGAAMGDLTHSDSSGNLVTYCRRRLAP